MISRLRAGLLITFAVVPMMAGAQAAQACTEPALGDLPARGQEKKLVRFELTGLTPGSEYLLKVNGRERKSGIAAGDRVSRRFRMPNLGDSNRRVKVAVVIAHDECENSPWKLEEKMTYRPQPEPQAPAAQPDPAPAPEPAPAPAPAPEANAGPSPPPAPAPPAAPSITDPAPDPPAVPKSSIAPAPAAPAAPATAKPPKDGRAWTTPVDPYQRGDNDPPKPHEGVLSRLDRPSEIANSTGALIGLGGLFLLLAGVGVIGWNKFRSYDDDRLEELLNPEGKLPAHLDANAKDIAGGPAPAPRKLKRKAPLPTVDPTAAGGAETEAAPDPPVKRKGAKRKAPLPTVDPTAAGAQTAAAAGAAAAASGKDEHADDSHAKGRLQNVRRRLRRKAPSPAADSPPPSGATDEPAVEAPAGPGPNGKASPSAVPPIVAPHANGAGHVNGTPPAPPPPAAKPPADPPPARQGDAPAPRSYREEVETELQRILDDAGLNTQVDGILADAKKEAQRQGVPIDSELMLKALCDETNGATKLSDSARGELESRFRRIVAEERGEHGRSPGS